MHMEVALMNISCMPESDDFKMPSPPSAPLQFSVAGMNEMAAGACQVTEFQVQHHFWTRRGSTPWLVPWQFCWVECEEGRLAQLPLHNRPFSWLWLSAHPLELEDALDAHLVFCRGNLKQGEILSDTLILQGEDGLASTWCGLWC